MMLGNQNRARSFRSTSRDRSRGLSDVIGTILLLGLTVTLFASVFLFVNTFPTPSPQPTGQFSAGLGYTYISGVGTVIASVNLGHIAGPTLFNTVGTQIYITASQDPTAFTAPFTVADGLGGASSWPLGATWSLNVTGRTLTLPDNLTVSILTNDVLVYRDVLPGSYPTVAPEFTNSGIVPADPFVGNSFQVYVQISDQNLRTSSSNHNVTVNYSLVPGPGFASAPPLPLTWDPVTGSWQGVIPAGSTESGAYFVYVTAKDTNGLTNTIAIPVNIILNPSGIGPVSVAISLGGPSAIEGTPSSIYATVTDNGAAGGAATVQFSVGGSGAGSASGGVSAGSSVAVSVTYTWTSVGFTTILAKASVLGVGSANSTLSLTVYPSILFIAKNTPFTTAKTYSAGDEAGWLQQALVADGIPFNSTSLSCTTALSAVVGGYTLSSFGVVIIDYGSSNFGIVGGGPCKNDLSLDETEITSIVSGHTTSFWLIGSNMISSCSGPSASFQAAFGLDYAATPCGSSVGLPATSVVYTGAPSVGLESAGISGSFQANSSVGFPANTSYFLDNMNGLLQPGATATPFLAAGSSDLGTYFAPPSSGIRDVFETVDPSMLVQTLPAPTSAPVDSGAAAASVAYNVIDYLGGLTTAATTGSTPGGISDHGGTDFGVSEVAVVGHNAGTFTYVYAAIRSNGLTPGTVTVILLVNGSPALFGGATVGSTVYITGDGTTLFVTLTWRAPSAGSYSLSVEIFAAGDSDALNNQLGPGILGQPIAFS
ncbi:MAG: hypothetical protein ACYDFT_03850 [Thermoplasmata archaeon]